MPGEVQQAIEDDRVNTFCAQHIDRPPEERSEFDCGEAPTERFADHLAKLACVDGTEQMRHHAHDAQGDGFGTRRRGEPTGEEPHQIDRAQLRLYELRCQKIALDEYRQSLPDPVLVLGHDRGVRNRQAERLPEDRGHGEPIGERPNYGGLGSCANE
jgi:hypothetical protein